MHCLQAEEHFSAHYEDTLDYRVLHDFEAHLAECEMCQSEYARFQESVKAIQQLPQIEPSPDFMPRLQQRLAEERREIGGVKEIAATSWEHLQDMFRRPRWAFSGIVALILIAVGGYLYQDSSLFNQDSQPIVEVVSTPERSQIGIPPVELPVRVRRSVENVNPFSPRGVISTSRQPMQQHYILKQVSYTNASTRGGL